MKPPPPWLTPWRMACLVAGQALIGPAVSAQPAPAVAATCVPAPSLSSLTLPQALAAAWDRSLASAEAVGRQRLALAEQRVASSWLAAPASLDLSQRTGRGSGADGARETEVGVALPLWRLGQRAQHTQAAQAESDWAAASELSARLELAGRLRAQISQVRMAEADALLATGQRQLLEELNADVERRVRAGELAPTDAMATQADVLAALSAEREAELTLRSQLSAWTVLTGLASLPDPEALPALDDAALSAHPHARLAEAAALRAQQRVARVQTQGGTPPELGIGVRQERPGADQAQQGSVVVSLRLPFGTQTHNAPALAAAMADQDMALMSLQRVRQQLEAELTLARSQLASASAQAQAQAQRAALLRERARLLKRSFQAGESPLPELLRAMAAAAQAEAAAARQCAALTQAQARLLQALGPLP